MRNTRSVRIPVILLCAGLLVGLMVPRLWASSAMPEAPQVHVVSAGETLWELAATYAPDDDPRRFVHEIRRVNGLEGVVLMPGQTLEIPTF